MASKSEGDEVSPALLQDFIYSGGRGFPVLCRRFLYQRQLQNFLMGGDL